jgi:N-acetylmuramoyl-L-alanine amidase
MEEKNQLKIIQMEKKTLFDKCVFYDCGHGGFDPVSGEYTTPPTTGKKFHHDNGLQYHGDGWFYEGVKNRTFGWRVMELLREAGVNVIEVSHPYEDNSLASRVSIANEYHKNVMPGIYISEHSNASGPHTARGFSVWTSKGQTKSDVLADKFYKMYVDEFETSFNPHRVHARGDMTDGDHDYEANFYVLSNTVMPAVLMENLFFDQPQDANALISEGYKERYCKLQAAWILWALKNS